MLIVIILLRTNYHIFSIILLDLKSVVNDYPDRNENRAEHCRPLIFMLKWNYLPEQTNWKENDYLVKNSSFVPHTSKMKLS